MTAIDLNADLGESFGRWRLGDDDGLLEVVTSANVACGFHAGDPTVLRHVCTKAAEQGVAIGAHVSYRDLAGFGRRFLDVPPTELTNDVLYQIGALDAFAHLAGTRVSYVKPHGALYNAIVDHESQAAAIVDAVQLYDPTLSVLGLPGSAWLRRAAAAGLQTIPEAFADRAYTPDATLVPRTEPGSVLHDVDQVTSRCVQMVTDHQVVSSTGTTVAIDARSVCVHGDSPGAVRMARAIRAALEGTGANLRAFTAKQPQ